MITPALYELFILAVIGVSGISAALLLGVRRPITLVALGLASSVVIRVLSALVLWTIGEPALTLELWFWLSVAVSAVGLVMWIRHWRVSLVAAGIFAAVAFLAWGFKYLLPVGEMQHTDSAGQISLALLAIQADSDNLGLIAGDPKKGIAFPLMIALGPGGRILSSFVPLVFFTSVLLVGWLTVYLTRHLPARIQAIALGAVAVFSLTVPMIRISAFYINSHTLMGLAVLLMMTGIMIARRKSRLTVVAAAFFTFGGIIGVTTRIEGVMLVIVAAVILSAESWWTLRSRLRFGFSLGTIGLTLTWWLSALQSSVPDTFGLDYWILAVITVVGATLAPLKWLDSIRPLLIPVLAVVLVVLLAEEIWTSPNPSATALAQWPNLVEGAGGWATAALVFGVVTVASGWKMQSENYRRLLITSVLMIGMIFFSKTFDGSFGRESFYDSVNRMILHITPLIATTASVGLANLVARLAGHTKGTQAKRVSVEA